MQRRRFSYRTELRDGGPEPSLGFRNELQVAQNDVPTASIHVTQNDFHSKANMLSTFRLTNPFDFSRAIVDERLR